MGSFHVGGRLIEVTRPAGQGGAVHAGRRAGALDPNGTYQVEQMYAQYFLPQNRKGKLPLLLWHGGGLTGVTYETKPDGQRGLAQLFPAHRAGTPTSPTRWSAAAPAGPTRFKGDPVFLPLGDPWERFRIGPPGSWNDDKAKRATYPGVQFPIDAYEQFMKQGVPRWITTDDADRRRLSRAGRQGLPLRRAGAQPGRRVRLQGRARRGPTRSRRWSRSSRRCPATKDKIAALKNMPIVVIYGDNAKDHPRWGKIRQNVVDYARGDPRRPAATSMSIDLPDIGIKGNTHMVMMDKNSDQVADVIQKWLAGKGFGRLMRRSRTAAANLAANILASRLATCLGRGQDHDYRSRPAGTRTGAGR